MIEFLEGKLVPVEVTMTLTPDAALMVKPGERMLAFDDGEWIHFFKEDDGNFGVNGNRALSFRKFGKDDRAFFDASAESVRVTVAFGKIAFEFRVLPAGTKVAIS